MNTIKVKGMVISVMPMDEYDRRIEILTDSLGKISAFARGARKPSSPFVAPTRIFAFGEFDLYEGRNSYSLNSAHISNYFNQLTEDVELAAYGFYFLEVASYFSKAGLDGTQTLKLVYQSLRALSLDSLDNRLVRAIYELKMLEINGICPDVEHIQSQFVLDPSTIYAIDFVKRTPVEKLYTFRLTETVLKEFADVGNILLSRSVDKNFKSLIMLEEFA